LLSELLEVDAPDQFHGDKIDAASFAQVVGLNDVGVDQIRDQLGLADKVVDELLLVGVVLADDLDGDALDELARAVLLGFIDNSHPAFENFSDNIVPKFVLDGEQRHG
jgi:hypothetical protein